MPRLPTLGAALLTLVLSGARQAGPEPGPLQKALGDMEAERAWVYDDLPAGFGLAKKTGKPLLVVFRCVP